MNLRVRGPRGQSTLTGLEATTTTIADLQQRLEDNTGILAAEQQWLTGWPLLKLEVSGDLSRPLECLQLSHNDLLVVQQGPPAPAVPATTAAATDDAGSADAEMDEDPELAAAIAAQSAASPSGAPVSVILSDGTAVVRRIIASDNSCLFNAVGYVMEGSLQEAPHLRQVIAETVAADSDTFTEGFLGRPNKEYCQWILKADKWGGAIELSILSKFFACEIAAYDIQTQRQDVYGQDGGYGQQALLLYDGLHYDAMAVAAFDGAPKELDIRMFDPNAPQAAAIHKGAAELVAQAHKARQFTDVANFTLRCGACQLGLKGEKEALEHAKATGHANFQEYS
ncbi:hypothetical protein WJX84_002815 [Apatococcus fuscideae]|uniref:Ubiquitin thioesterase OTU n=1 Tax=Apatococcus fuscideae TaxID=2026836 RepID=A0AAW1SUC1_9CHLO